MWPNTNVYVFLKHHEFFCDRFLAHQLSLCECTLLWPQTVLPLVKPTEATRLHSPALKGYLRHQGRWPGVDRVLTRGDGHRDRGEGFPKGSKQEPGSATPPIAPEPGSRLLADSMNNPIFLQRFPLRSTLVSLCGLQPRVQAAIHIL